MKKPRLFSLLTAAVLTVSGFWQSAALTASAEPDFSGAAIPDSSALAFSDNTFGAMLADSINQENARIMMSSVVNDVTMDGTDATVSFDSDQSGKAVVCVYEDVSDGSAPRLLGTGIHSFNADMKTVTVPVLMDELPEFYSVRVFLIGMNGEPLSAEYSDPMHTREMQMLLQSDISDFMEDYEVLNMDGSTETNFAVYNKDVEVLHYGKTENRVLSQDNENRVFEIQNYTGPTKTGTIVSVECGNGTAAIFKIGSVKTDGDVTTIYGDRSMDPNDAFAYLKVEANSAHNEASMTPPELPEEYAHIPVSCDVIDDSKNVQKRPGITASADSNTDETEELEKEYKEDEIHFRIQLGKGLISSEDDPDSQLKPQNGIEINGFADFYFAYQATIYKTAMNHHVKLNMAFKLEIGAELCATIGFKFPFGTAIVFNPCSQIEFVLGPYLTGTVTGILTIETTFSWSYGSGNGFKANASVFSIELSVEGFIGVGLGGALEILDNQGELSVEIGLKIELTVNPPHEGCDLCYDLKFSVEGRLNATLTFEAFGGDVDFGINPSIEFELGHAYLSDTLKFGFGKCPNLMGIPTNPAHSSKIGPDGLTEQQRDQFVFQELSDGSGYAISFMQEYYDAFNNRSKDEESKELYESVRDKTTALIMPDTYNGKPVVEVRRFSYLSNLSMVVFPEGVKTIAQYAFDGSGTSSLTIPESVETIGVGAFRNSGFKELDFRPLTLTACGTDSFAGSAIESLYLPEGMVTVPAIFNKMPELRTISWPSTLRGISGFTDCPNYRIELPSYITALGDGAFSDIGKKSTIHQTVVIPESIIRMGKRLFNGRPIEGLTFSPNSPKLKAGESAFYQLDKVTSVRLPDSWTEIPDNMFAGCTNLREIKFPKHVRSIGKFALHGTGISRLDLPKTVESVYIDAFQNDACDVYFWNPETTLLKVSENEIQQIPAQFASLVLHGYEGSKAETFAKENGLTFITINPEETDPTITVPHSSQSGTQTGTSQPGTSQSADPTDAPQTMTFTDLRPNTVYNFYDLLGEEFTAENLLYLSQGVSDNDGNLTVWYRPKSDDTDAKKYVRCAPSKIKGDMNCDFVVDISDAVLCARFCAEDAEAIISLQGIRNADVDHDGNADSDDTILILKFIARLITSFD